MWIDWLFQRYLNEWILIMLLNVDVYYLCVHSGTEDKSHRTQKTDLSLVGGSATRRHPTKTTAGHLPKGEWVSDSMCCVNREHPLQYGLQIIMDHQTEEESTSVLPDGCVFLWGSYSILTAAVTIQWLPKSLRQTQNGRPTAVSSMPTCPGY